MRLQTKESRLNSQNIQFEHLIKDGYKRQDFETIKIFIKETEKHTFLFKVFRGTAAQAIAFNHYRTEEDANRAAEQHKDSERRRLAYKKELKDNPKKSSAANCAQAIREELKAVFPGIKFTVKSDNFSGGNSVSIGWVDGPTTQEVAKITGKYQYGHFNGMEDIYEYSNRRDDLPQAKYVSEHRGQGAEVLSQVDKLAKLIGEKEYDYRNEPAQILYRIFARTSIPAGAKVIGIERTGVNAGQWEDFYRLVLDVSEVKKEAESPIIEKPEIKAGEIQIIDYSEKAVAVIGDTKTIKDKLKELGGKFNPRLTCGPGWIFAKSNFEEVQKALQGAARAKEELKSEIDKTVDFFKETDVKIYGEVTESTKDIERIQNTITIKEERPEEYKNIQDITQAVNEGKVISLCNLYKIVNGKMGEA